jgi:hypothetical protein
MLTSIQRIEETLEISRFRGLVRTNLVFGTFLNSIDPQNILSIMTITDFGGFIKSIFR